MTGSGRFLLQSASGEATQAFPALSWGGGNVLQVCFSVSSELTQVKTICGRRPTLQGIFVMFIRSGNKIVFFSSSFGEVIILSSGSFHVWMNCSIETAPP